MRSLRFLLIMTLAVSPLAAQLPKPEPEPTWAKAADTHGPLSTDEAKAFMKKLARHAVEHHMKKAEASLQRGMMYEYLRWKTRGQPGQFIQGEALDTMHDGAWFAVAMCHAFRATKDPFYKEILVKWQLPFYLKMLNDGAQFFNSEKMDVRPESKDTWKNSKEWLLQGRENGFVPYWWDDGESVSLEMLGKKSLLPNFPCTNELADQPNPEFKLKGYSHGSSNHLAQNLAVMLLQSWLILKESKDPAEQELAKQVALGAKNLQECRTRHGSPNIPVVMAAYAVSNEDSAMLEKLDDGRKLRRSWPKNHYIKTVWNFTPDQKISTPGFADDQLYLYYAAVARNRSMTWPLALILIYDAFSIPILWQRYNDDAPVPPGMNRFDLYPLNFINGKPEHLRSQRKGPNGRPVPVGSRLGPQNMVVCALALQAVHRGDDFAAFPGQITSALNVIKRFPGIDPHADVAAWLKREVGGGLRTWEAVFHEFGYIPTGIGCNNPVPGMAWDELSDTGGYAHLISAAAQWVMLGEGRRDWAEW